MGITNKLSYPRTAFVLVVFSLLLSSCSVFDLSFSTRGSPTLAPPTSPNTQSELTYTTITFRARPPSGAPQGNITLEILDEVTGLAINPQRYPMLKNADGSFQVELLLPVGTVVKYRYLRGDLPYFVEYNSQGQQVRYRMAAVNYPLFIEDTIAGWTDFRYGGPTGTIKGQVYNSETKDPFPNALICVGGVQTLTASNGSFIVENIAEGFHHLVVYSLDGSFQTFQQGAIVAANSTTLALTPVAPSTFVNITFVVQTPPTNLQGLPLRIVGNTFPLGNTFAELNGGFSVVASRAPLLNRVTDNAYAISLRLPVGFDFRYKYTLGDGFWNAEHDQNGGFVLRQLIVPDEDTTIIEQVETWKSGNSGEITFLVSAPANTPLEDTLSIQLNPFTWTNPLPMWPLGNNQWLFVLYSPLNMFKELEYRYCRNDQCDYAGDMVTTSPQFSGYQLVVSNEPQLKRDEIKSWVKWNTLSQSLETDVQLPQQRSADFVQAIEFSPNYNPTWQPFWFWGLNKLNFINADTVVMTPSWTYRSVVSPNFEPLTGKDMLWLDSIQAIQTAQQANLTTWLYPRIRDHAEIWAEPHTDRIWWEKWFERYQAFTTSFADLASQTNTPVLILGGADVLAALPSGVLPNGDPSGVPEFANERWLSILDNVRQRYNGKIGWSVSFVDEDPIIPQWIDQVDLIYAQLSIPALYSPALTFEERIDQIRDYLESVVLPIQQTTQKPIVIAVNIPSTTIESPLCSTVNCIELEDFYPPLSRRDEVQENLETQVEMYQAVLTAVNATPWVNGFISQGYYPPVAIQDASSSINGKPAADVVKYWFMNWAETRP